MAINSNIRTQAIEATRKGWVRYAQEHLGRELTHGEAILIHATAIQFVSPLRTEDLNVVYQSDDICEQNAYKFAPLVLRFSEDSEEPRRLVV